MPSADLNASKNWSFEEQIVANIQDGLIVLDREARYVFWNSTMQRISGLPAEAVLGKKPLELFPFLNEVGFPELIQRAMAGETINTPDFPFDVKSTGLKGWTSQIMAPLRHFDGEIIGVIITVHDVTERVRIEDDLRLSSHRLKMLSRQLLNAQEDERRRLSREIHDDLGQILTAIKLSLNHTERIANDEVKLALRNEIAMIELAISSVRAISRNLRPEQLEILGLVPALRSLFNQNFPSVHLEMTVHSDMKRLSIPEHLELVCFRVAQESVTNAIRHAEPTRIDAELWADESKLVLVVRDDGIGFDVQGAMQRADQGISIGLLSMQERIEQVDGQLTIESSVESGTTVRIELPMS